MQKKVARCRVMYSCTACVWAHQRRLPHSLNAPLHNGMRVVRVRFFFKTPSLATPPGGRTLRGGRHLDLREFDRVSIALAGSQASCSESECQRSGQWGHLTGQTQRVRGRTGVLKAHARRAGALAALGVTWTSKYYQPPKPWPSTYEYHLKISGSVVAVRSRP